MHCDKGAKCLCLLKWDYAAIVFCKAPACPHSPPSVRDAVGGVAGKSFSLLHQPVVEICR